MLYGTRGCCSTIDNRDYGDEAFSIYGTSDSVIENSISENAANGFQIHGIANPLDPTGHGGRNNRVLGSISFEDTVASLVSSRSDGPTGYHNASGNLFRDFVAARMRGNGIYLRAAADSHVENVTLFGSLSNSGLVADESGGDLGGTCSASLVCSVGGGSCSSNEQCGKGVCTRNADGCSFVATNMLAMSNAGYGLSSSQHSFVVDFANAAGNASNFGVGEPIGDLAGAVRSSTSRDPTGVGFGGGRCLLWIPPGSNMQGAGRGGADIGANILTRYEGGQLTQKPLWDPASGRFPCGAVVGGINDGPKRCGTLHERLNVNRNGCAFPPGYGS
jgi:hypothetical protein